MTYSADLLRIELRRDEGKANKPYTDSVGKLTIGIGRNLTDVGISDATVYQMLDEDIKRSEHDLNVQIPWWTALTDARQRVLLNMVFNMGWGDGSHGLSTFKNTLAAIHNAQYGTAADMMLKSKWAQQVGARADRLSEMMRNG